MSLGKNGAKQMMANVSEPNNSSPPFTDVDELFAKRRGLRPVATFSKVVERLPPMSVLLLLITAWISALSLQIAQKACLYFKFCSDGLLDLFLFFFPGFILHIKYFFIIFALFFKLHYFILTLLSGEVGCILAVHSIHYVSCEIRHPRRTGFSSSSRTDGEISGDSSNSIKYVLSVEKGLLRLFIR